MKYNGNPDSRLPKSAFHPDFIGTADRQSGGQVLGRKKVKITWIGAFILAACISLFLSPMLCQAYYWVTGDSADVVVGQPDMTSNLNWNRPWGFHWPWDICADTSLYVADRANCRVAIFNPIPTANGASAGVFVGQPNGYTNSPGCGPTTTDGVKGVCSDGTKLYIADYPNNRVLIFDPIPIESGDTANVVIGQGDFISNTPGCCAPKLHRPNDVYSDGTKLFIADTENNRVLIYNSIPTLNGASADVAVGQPNLYTCTSGCTATKLYEPWGVYSDGTRLYIADTYNNRVLIYNSIPTSNGASADVVVGQTDMTSNSGGCMANKLSVPGGVYSDGTRLYIAEYSNNRVLIFNSIPTSNGDSADVVIGQTSMTANSSGCAADKLYQPIDVYINGTKLYIADTYNNRVLIYNSHASTVTVDGVSIAPSGVSPGDTEVGMIKLSVCTNTGIAIWSDVKVDLTGTAVDSDISSVEIWKDDGDGIWEGSGQDTEIGSGTFSFNTTTINFGTSETITTSSQDYYVVYDIASEADPSHTAGAELADTSYITVTSPDVVSSANFPIQSDEVTLPVDDSGYEYTIFKETKLENYPNPFKSHTTIAYAIKGRKKAEEVEIRIYNVVGQLVETIEATNGIAVWEFGHLPTGIYFYQLKIDSYNKVKKMILLR